LDASAVQWWYPNFWLILLPSRVKVKSTTIPFLKIMNDQDLLEAAIEEARKGLGEGGLPIGSVLADKAGKIIARGHNLRVQSSDPTAHAETVCIRNAGRRRDWEQLTLISTLSPCIMCTGTALLYRIPRVIIGENQNFFGAEDLFRERGVAVIVLDDAECIRMMKDFILTHADLWNEDIGK
jgi:cytosine/creatinine deaminase